MRTPDRSRSHRTCRFFFSIINMMHDACMVCAAVDAVAIGFFFIVVVVRWKHLSLNILLSKILNIYSIIVILNYHEYFDDRVDYGYTHIYA